MLRAVASGALLPEQVLWSLLVQLTAALRVIHAAGLACRYVRPIVPRFFFLYKYFIHWTYLRYITCWYTSI